MMKSLLAVLKKQLNKAGHLVDIIRQSSKFDETGEEFVDCFKFSGGELSVCCFGALGEYSEQMAGYLYKKPKIFSAIVSEGVN